MRNSGLFLVLPAAEIGDEVFRLLGQRTSSERLRRRPRRAVLQDEVGIGIAGIALAEGAVSEQFFAVVVGMSTPGLLRVTALRAQS